MFIAMFSMDCILFLIFFLHQSFNKALVSSLVFQSLMMFALPTQFARILCFTLREFVGLMRFDHAMFLFRV